MMKDLLVIRNILFKIGIRCRDGLKPVQRRTTYAIKIRIPMINSLKCANAVGNVLGKYHPHGDFRYMTP